MSHTPTPWRVDAAHNGTFVRGADGRSVSSLEAGYQQTRDNDAAFIVRACNAHDELVAALERVSEAFKRGHYPELQGVACDVFAALAKSAGSHPAAGSPYSGRRMSEAA